MDNKRRKTKVLVVGWDGGSFNVLDVMMRKGLMPHLSSLIENGVRANFVSTTPPITAPAWTSLRTGKRPDNHGIFSFFKSPRKSLEIRDIERHTAQSIQVNTLWNILNSNERKVCVIDMPFTDPVEQIDGIIVSGMMTRGKRGVLTHPVNLRDELIKVFPDYFNKTLSDGINVSVAFIEHLIDTLRWKEELDIYLMKRYEWDSFITVFSAVDILQHYFWRFIDDKSLSFKKNKNIIEKIHEFYHQLDIILGKYFTFMNDNDMVFVVSDHGFQAVNYSIYVNNILERMGYLTTKQKPLNLVTKYLNTQTIKGAIKRFDLFHLRHMIKKEVREKIKKNLFLDDVPIIWDQTKAYFRLTSEEGIYINKKGKFDHGNVNDREYSDVVESLINHLANMKNPANDEHVFDFVRKRDDVYCGKFKEDAPDIILRPAEGYICKRYKYGGLPIAPFDDPFLSGTHRTEGIFIGKGMPFNQNKSKDFLSIEDFVPILLYSLDIPIPDDLDGAIPLPIFKNDFLATMKPGYKKYDKTNVSFSQESLDKIERDKIVQQLSQLGYIN